MSQYHKTIDIASDVVRVIAFRVKRNPVLVGAAALWAYETISTQDALTWQGAVTVLVGFLTRSQTVPANEVWNISEELDQAIEDARAEFGDDDPDTLF